MIVPGVDLATFGVLAMLGTVLGLDGVTVGQAMLSRPLVGATLAGLVCGAPGPALVAGVLLEAVALETLPVGASRYPDWAPAGVAAGTIAAVATPLMPALTLALLAGIVVAWSSGRSMVVLRHANGRRIAAAQAALAAGDATMPASLVWRGIAGDAARAAAMAALALAIVPVAVWIAARWRLDPFTTGAVTAVSALMVTASSTRQMFHGASLARPLFAAALVVGIAVVAVRYG
ncbi:MAG: hypothetical protein MUF53_10525 [Gemmatimonadaceae bacterium]|nr:hypothetical protein [Gemmatimonadaceae bacterium]